MVYYYDEDDDDDLTYRAGGSIHRNRSKSSMSLPDEKSGEMGESKRVFSEARDLASGESTGISKGSGSGSGYGYDEARAAGVDMTEMGSGAMTRGTQNAMAGNADMGMATMAKVGAEMGGSEAVMSGQTSGQAASMAGTGMGSATASMGGAEGVLGGSGGGMSTGGYMSAIGSMIGGMDDSQDEADDKLFADNSQEQANMAASRAANQGSTMDVQALLDKAKRFAE